MNVYWKKKKIKPHDKKVLQLMSLLKRLNLVVTHFCLPCERVKVLVTFHLKLIRVSPVLFVFLQGLLTEYVRRAKLLYMSKFKVSPFFFFFIILCLSERQTVFRVKSRVENDRPVCACWFQLAELSASCLRNLWPPASPDFSLVNRCGEQTRVSVFV